MSEQEQIDETEKIVHIPREIVYPGQIITTDENMNPGRGTMKEGNTIISIFMGIKSISGNYVNIIPLKGLYAAQRGDKIIGKVVRKLSNKLIVDINSHFYGILSAKNAEFKKSFQRNKRYGSYTVQQNDAFSKIYEGDIIICKVLSASKKDEPELSMVGRYLGPIFDGFVLKIAPPKIPRVIGKKGSMISMLKEALNCKMFVAQNGRIWIHGSSIENERILVDAIHKIENEAHTMNLTSRIEHYVKKQII